VQEPCLVVYCTCPDQAVAERIATALVEEKLAACVNIVGGIVSIYRWQDGLQRDPEVLLIIKTRENSYPLLEGRIRELHPYDVAEVIALPIVRGAADYLDWLAAGVEA
jgi:periplasmic divalent cation tolerance protein